MPTTIKALLKSESGRLLAALLGSVIIHLAPFIWGWLPYLSTREPARQITFSATLQPLKKAAMAKPEKTPPREKANNARPQRKKQPPSIPKGEKLLASIGKGAHQTEAEKESERGKASDQKSGSQDDGSQKSGSQDDGSTGNDSVAVAMDTANVPAYPAEAVRQGLESCVLAAVRVSASGEVTAVHILHADVPGIFDRSVVDAQSAVRYLPARKNGETLPSRILAVASFTLEPGRHLNCARQYAAAARMINALPVSAEISAGMLEGLIGGR